MFRKAAIPALIVVAVAGGWIYRANTQTVETTTAAPTTREVVRSTLEKTILASGVVEASQLVSVGAEVSGRIETLSVDVGDTVALGDVIAVIDSSDQEIEVQTAEASLNEVAADIVAQQATIRSLEVAAKRQEDLRTRGVNTQADLDTAEADLQVAQANLQSLEARKAQAELSLSTAQRALERTQITAPIAGTVVAVVNGEGTTVNASNSTPTIVKIADLTAMDIVASVSEADVAGVTAGLDARFTLPGVPDRTFEAKLDGIAPAPASIADSDEISTDEAIYYEARLTVPNEDGALRIGMTAEVTVVLESAADALSIPLSAVGPKGPDGSTTVSVWDGSSARPQKVSIGLTTDDSAQVLEGLAEGDAVVVANAVAGGSPTGGGSNMRMGPPMGF